jgi:uncharacterized protein
MRICFVTRKSSLLLAILIAAQGGQARSESPEGLDAALVKAAEAGKAASVRSLLKRGASPNAANTDGNSLTALMLAARGGHSDVVRILLQASAKVDATASVPVGASGGNTGLTALMMAAASGDLPTIKLLLDHQADPNAKVLYKVTDASGTARIAGSQPVLMQAGTAEVLRLLVDNGADLHVKDADGRSVLMFAAENLDPAAVSYLLSKGLDPHEKNGKGMSALDLAKQAEKADNLKLLEAAGP